jgi:hypothetical protein
MTSPREQRWSRRVPFSLRFSLTALVMLSAGIVIGVRGSYWASTNILAIEVSPTAILVSADQRTLTGTVPDGCMTGTLVVDEGAAAVTVRVREFYTTEIPFDSCPTHAFVATLRSPLGKRRLIDGVGGTQFPPSGPGILRPTVLPPGFVHQYDTVSFPGARGYVPNVAAPGTTAYVQLFALTSSYNNAIWISETNGGVWHTPDASAATPVTVRGHPGEAVPGMIEWTEGGQLITIQSYAYPYATLGLSDLLAIGNGMR